MSRLHLIILALLALAVVPAAQSAAPAKQPALNIAPVGRLPFPERGFVVDLPKGARIDPKRVHVSENGLGVGNFTFRALAGSGVRDGTVLAIDTSDSMIGKPEAAALAAARTFVNRRNTNQEVGLVTFNGAVKVVRTPTVDGNALHDALAQVATARLRDAHLRRPEDFARAAHPGEDLRRLDRPALGRCRRREHGDDAERDQDGTGAPRAHLHRRSPQRRVRRRRRSARSLPRQAEAMPRPRRERSSRRSTRRSAPRSPASTSSSTALPPPRNSTVAVEITLAGIGSAGSQYVAPKPSELAPYHRPFFRTLILSGWSLALLALAVMGLLALRGTHGARGLPVACGRPRARVLRRCAGRRREIDQGEAGGLAQAGDSGPRLRLDGGARVDRGSSTSSAISGESGCRRCGSSS